MRDRAIPLRRSRSIDRALGDDALRPRRSAAPRGASRARVCRATSRRQATHHSRRSTCVGSYHMQLAGVRHDAMHIESFVQYCTRVARGARPTKGQSTTSTTVQRAVLVRWSGGRGVGESCGSPARRPPCQTRCKQVEPPIRSCVGARIIRIIVSALGWLVGSLFAFPPLPPFRRWPLAPAS